MKFNRIKIQLISIFMLFLLLPYQSCKEDQNNIPYVPVKFSILLDVYNQLTTPGYSMLFEGVGYGGVIVFCEFYDITTPSNSIYYAFDATCTNEISEDCTLEVEGNSVNAVCPCCESEYSLYGGYPFKGNASIALKQYNITLLNNTLYISN